MRADGLYVICICERVALLPCDEKEWMDSFVFNRLVSPPGGGGDGCGGCGGDVEVTELGSAAYEPTKSSQSARASYATPRGTSKQRRQEVVITGWTCCAAAQRHLEYTLHTRILIYW